MFDSTSLSGNTVTFKLTSENEVIFQVNSSCNKQEVSNKVAITKWLLTKFKEAQSREKYLYCRPYSEDGFGDVRAKVFTKLGFISNKEILEWGDIAKKPLPYAVNLSDNNNLPYITKQGRLEVTANVGEWRQSIPLPYRIGRGSLLVVRNEGDWLVGCDLPSRY